MRARTEAPSARPTSELPARLLPVSIILLLAVFPPETHGGGMAGGAAMIALLTAAAWAREIDPIGRTVLVVAVVAAAPLVLAAAAPGAAVEPLATFVLAGMLGVHATCLSRTVRDSDAVPWALAAAGALVALFAVYQALGGLEATAAQVEAMTALPDRDVVLARLRSGRAFSTFATPAALGGYLALAAPGVVGLGMARRGRSRVALFAAAGFMGLGMLVTMSVTALGALAGAVILAFVIQIRRWKPTVMAGAVGVVLLLVAIGLRKDEILDRSRWDSPWRLRAGNFRVATEVISDHPWIGVGPGGFGEVFPRYRREGDNETRHVHDLPLEMMAELGVVPGAIAGGLFLVLFLGPVARRRDESPEWARGVRIGLAAFALQNLIDFTAYFPSILWTAALLRGVTAEPGAGERERPSSGWRWSRGILLAATLVATTIAGLAGLAWEARYEVRRAATDRDAAGARSRLELASRIAPWSVDTQSMYAQALLEQAGTSKQEATLRAALERSSRAVALSPARPSTREVRAGIRLALGDTPGAFVDLAEAARLYPLEQRYARLRDRLEPRVPKRPDLGRASP